MTSVLRQVSIRACLILTACAVILSTLPFHPAHANSPWWHADVSNMQGDSLLTAPNGDVTVSHCSGTESTVNTMIYHANGTTGDSINNATNPHTYICNSQRAIGKDGKIYGVQSDGSYGTDLVAYIGGARLWSHHFQGQDPQCQNSQLSIQHIFTGQDGNMYVSMNEANPWCNAIGYVAAISPMGKEMFITKLSGNTLSWMGLYDKGFAITQNLTHSIRIFNLNGEEQNSISIDFPQGDHNGIHRVVMDADGTLFVTVGMDMNSTDQCRTNIVTDRILTYSASGQLLATYKPAKCSYIDSISAGPWGAVFIVKNHDTSVQKDSLVTLNKKGTVQLTRDLPYQVDDYYFTKADPIVLGDTNGNIILKQTYSRKQSNGLLGAPNVLLALMDPATGTQRESFDTNIFQSNAGFIAQDLQLGNGMAYLLGQHCTDYSCVYGTPHQLYGIPLQSIGMDYPRGHELSSEPSTPTPRTISFLGDSYMSGEGIPPFGPGVADSKCHRSTHAWPLLAQQDAAVSMHLQNFSACSGATISDMLNGTKKPRQITKKNLDGTQDVVISVGGDDIQFSKLITTCLLVDCRDSAKNTQKLTQQLTANYKKLITKTQSITGSSAHLYFMGYPTVLAPQKCQAAPLAADFLGFVLKAGSNGDPRSLVLAKLLVRHLDLNWRDVYRNAISDGFGFSDQEAVYINLVEAKLNLTMRDAVTANGATFISATNPDSPFIGHEICPTQGATSYFNGYYLDFGSFDWVKIFQNTAYSFHPNQNGAQAYEEIFRKAYQNVY